MTAHDRQFPTLNALRAIGAIMVVLTHAAFNTGRINDGWSGAALARFDFGVTIFFILSGFLLSRPWFLAAALGEDSPSARHYLWKRSLRILPLYWVVVVVALTFDPANDDADWVVWVTNLTFTQLYRPELLPSSLTQMWSLCTEVAFYLVLPLLCIALIGRRGRGLPLRRVLVGAAVLSALGVAWQVRVSQIPGDEGHYAQWLPGFLPWFLVGVCFAALSASLAVDPRPHPVERLGHDLVGCWVLAAAVFAIAWSPVAGPRSLLTPDGWEAGSKLVLYTVAGAFFVLPLVFGPERDGWARTRLSGPVPVWLGDISYGIFALHMFFLNLLTLPVATASYYLVERRILRAKNLRFVARLDSGARPVRATVE